MKCRDVEREMLEAALRGARSLRGASAGHLLHCAPCASHWEQELRTTRLLEESRRVERIPRGAGLRIEEAIRRSAAARPAGGPVWLPALAAGVLTVLALAVGMLYAPRGARQAPGPGTQIAATVAPTPAAGPSAGSGTSRDVAPGTPAPSEAGPVAVAAVSDARPARPDEPSGPRSRTARREPTSRETHGDRPTGGARGTPRAHEPALAEMPFTLEVASVGFSTDIGMGSSPLRTDVADAAPTTTSADWPVSFAVRSSSIASTPTPHSEVTPR